MAARRSPTASRTQGGSEGGRANSYILCHTYVALSPLWLYVQPSGIFSYKWFLPPKKTYAAMACATSCHACGKSGAKLLRCGRCRTVWFCNRECQVVAARQGHSGANCRAADNASTAHKAADAEAAPRLPDAAKPSTTEPESAASTMTPTASSCHACGKSGAKLLRCARCRNVWFCNRECQILARKELGHRGANCRADGGAQRSPFSSDAPSQPSTPMAMATLLHSWGELMGQAQTENVVNTRIGNLAAVAKCNEAATVADHIGGQVGACRRSDTDQVLCTCLFNLGDRAAAARAACSSLRAARIGGSTTLLVAALTICGQVARESPSEMAIAEIESREQEILSGSPSLYSGLDLTDVGRIILPTSPGALSRMGLAYNEAAVATCVAALAATGGRSGNMFADDERGVPTLKVEAESRSILGSSLCRLGEDRQRGLELLRQAVTLWRLALRTWPPGDFRVQAQLGLANELDELGCMVKLDGFTGMVEAEACIREALALCEGTGDVWVPVKTVRCLINLCGAAHAAVTPAEAEALRLRLNQLLVQMGREPETSCSICLDPLAPPADGAAEDAVGGGGSGVTGGLSDSCVRVLNCDHQFHNGCLSTWQRTTSSCACPLCKLLTP